MAPVPVPSTSLINVCSALLGRSFTCCLTVTTTVHSYLRPSAIRFESTAILFDNKRRSTKVCFSLIRASWQAMSLVLEGAVPPPHLLQSASTSAVYSYPSPDYPAQASSPAPMSPRSLHTYFSRLSGSPLQSELDVLPTSTWYGPSISAPEAHNQVIVFLCRSILAGYLLTCLECLLLIWHIFACSVVLNCPVTIDTSFPIPSEASSAHTRF